MTDVDLRDPDLGRVWAVLEDLAPPGDWETVCLQVRRRRRPLVHALAFVMAALMLLLVGSETVGVLAVRRATASGVTVSPDAVALPVVAVDAAHPWSRVVDVLGTSAGIFAYGSDSDGESAVWRLAGSGSWADVGLDADLVIDGAVFGAVEYLAGLRGSQAVIWRGDAAGWRPVVTVGEPDGPQASWSALAATPDGLIAFGWSDGAPHAWASADGATWNEIESAGLDRVGEAVSIGDVVVVAGGDESLIPVVDPEPVVWTFTRAGAQSRIEMPDRRSLGFGYVLGGFRMPDGIEHVIPTRDGAIAFTGFLQAWSGIGEDGFLEPSEAWASMVMTSPDLETWESHILADFAIADMVPLGDGFLAVAALPPADPAGFDIEAKLYYSDDALTWQPVEGTSLLGKPLIAVIDGSTAMVLDEYATERDGASQTEAFVVSAQ